MKFHELVKKKRKEKGLSQTELAERVESKQPTISDFEKGKAGINSRLLELIFTELDIKIKEEENN